MSIFDGLVAPQYNWSTPTYFNPYTYNPSLGLYGMSSNNFIGSNPFKTSRTASSNTTQTFKNGKLVSTTTDNPNVINNGSYWFDKNGNFNWGNAADFGLDAFQIGAGLYNGIMGYQAYKQAKQQYAFQKALANRNLYNQVKQINNAYDAAAANAAGLGGSYMTVNGLAQGPSQETIDKFKKNAETKHLDGSPIS